MMIVRQKSKIEEKHRLSKILVHLGTARKMPLGTSITKKEKIPSFFIECSADWLKASDSICESGVKKEMDQNKG